MDEYQASDRGACGMVLSSRRGESPWGAYTHEYGPGKIEFNRHERMAPWSQFLLYPSSQWLPDQSTLAVSILRPSMPAQHCSIHP